jgi:hypothetical protein
MSGTMASARDNETLAGATEGQEDNGTVIELLITLKGGGRTVKAYVSRFSRSRLGGWEWTNVVNRYPSLPALFDFEPSEIALIRCRRLSPSDLAKLTQSPL